MVSSDEIVVGSIMALLIVALVMELRSPEVLFLCALTVTWLSGVLPLSDALSGFSNESLVSMGSLFIVASAVERSHVVDELARKAFGLHGGFRLSLLRVLLSSFVLSFVLSNTPLVALLMPLVRDWCRVRNFGVDESGTRAERARSVTTASPIGPDGPASPTARARSMSRSDGDLSPRSGTSPLILPRVRPNTGAAASSGGSVGLVFMPMDFAVLAGGLATTIGSSSNLIVQGLLSQAGLRTFEIWEPALIAVPLGLAIIVIMVISAPWILPTGGQATASAVVSASGGGTTKRVRARAEDVVTQLRVEDGSPFIGKEVGLALAAMGVAPSFLVKVRRMADPTELHRLRGAPGSGKGPGGEDEQRNSELSFTLAPDVSGIGPFPASSQPVLAHGLGAFSLHSGPAIPTQRDAPQFHHDDGIELAVRNSPGSLRQARFSDGTTEVRFELNPAELGHEHVGTAQSVAQSLFSASSALFDAIPSVASAASSSRAHGQVRRQSSVRVPLRQVDLPPHPSIELNAGDVLFVACAGDVITTLQHATKAKGLSVLSSAVEDLAGSGTDMVELVLSTENPFLTMPLAPNVKEINALYGVSLVGYRRRAARRATTGEGLGPGDTLLVVADADALVRMEDSPDFFLVARVGEVPRKRTWVSFVPVFVFLVMLVVVALDAMPMVQASMVAAMIVLAGGWVPPEDLPRVVEWRVLMMVGCSLSFSRAITKSGLATGIARVIELGGSGQPFWSMFLLFFVTLVVTEFINNNATVAIMLPVALALSDKLGASYRPFAMAVYVAASSGHMSPIGYQTHVMVWRPGGYSFSDFARFGFLPNVVALVFSCLVIPRLWPF